MTSEADSPAPLWFRVVSILALLWNLLGVVAYLDFVRMTPEDLSAMPEAERMLYESTPAWATAAFAIAVFAGVIGCLLLLMKRSIALPVLILSLAGVLAQMTHSLLLSNSVDVLGPRGMIMPLVVIVIAVALVWLARKGNGSGWLNQA